jgi:hypothetical protein
MGHEVMPHEHHSHHKHSHNHHHDDQDSHQNPFSDYFHEDGGVQYLPKTFDSYSFQQTSNVSYLIKIPQILPPVVELITTRRPPSKNLQLLSSYFNSSGKLRGPPIFIA